MSAFKSFAQRQAIQDKAKALNSLTTSDKLLAHILIELMNTRGHHSMNELAERLKTAGLSTKQAAAILDTTPATLAVLKRRSEEAEPAEAVARADR